jgi:hypothetical protein
MVFMMSDQDTGWATIDLEMAATTPGVVSELRMRFAKDSPPTRREVGIQSGAWPS